MYVRGKVWRRRCDAYVDATSGNDWLYHWPPLRRHPVLQSMSPSSSLYEGCCMYSDISHSPLLSNQRTPSITLGPTSSDGSVDSMISSRRRPHIALYVRKLILWEEATQLQRRQYRRGWMHTRKTWHDCWLLCPSSKPSISTVTTITCRGRTWRTPWSRASPLSLLLPSLRSVVVQRFKRFSHLHRLFVTVLDVPRRVALRWRASSTRHFHDLAEVVIIPYCLRLPLLPHQPHSVAVKRTEHLLPPSSAPCIRWHPQCRSEPHQPRVRSHRIP